jgi:hypothetical protein
MQLEEREDKRERTVGCEKIRLEWEKIRER